MARRFSTSQRIDLSFAGKGWETAYIELAIPSYGELRAVTKLEGTDQEKAEAMLTFLTDHFVSGKAPDNGIEVDLVAGDIGYMPITVVTKCISHVTGEELVSPN